MEGEVFPIAGRELAPCGFAEPHQASEDSEVEQSSMRSLKLTVARWRLMMLLKLPMRRKMATRWQDEASISRMDRGEAEAEGIDEIDEESEDGVEGGDDEV